MKRFVVLATALSTIVTAVISNAAIISVTKIKDSGYAGDVDVKTDVFPKQ